MSAFVSRLAAFLNSMLGGTPAAGRVGGRHGEVPFNAFSGTMIFGCRRIDR